MGPGNDKHAASRFTAGEVGELLGTVTGRLPRSGSSQDKIYTQPNRDYPDDTDIWFERGNSSTVVRLTPADRPKLLTAIGGLAPRLAELRAKASRHFDGTELDPLIVVDLLAEAHAAGYRLCDEDYRMVNEDVGQVADFLAEKLEEARETEQLAPGEIGPGPDVRALERVIAMLGEK